MPLISAKTTVPRRRAFEAALQHLVQLGRVPAGLHVNPEPHPIYVLSSKDVIGDAYGTAAARLVSWRYFAADIWNTVVVGDVSNTNPPKVTGLRYGDTGKRALNVKKKMEALPELQAADYEPRILRVPGALAEAFWLHSLSGSAGLVVPCQHVFGSPCQEGQPYAIDHFLETLRPLEKAPNSRAS